MIRAVPARRLRPTAFAAALLVVLACGLATTHVRAADPATPPPPTTTTKGPDLPTLLLGLAEDDFDKKRAAIDALAHAADMRLIPLLDAYGQGALYLWENRVVYGPESKKDAAGDTVVKLYDALSREPLTKAGADVVVPVKSLKEVSASRKERPLIRDATTLLRLSDPDKRQRLSAVIRAGDSGTDTTLPALRELLKTEKEKKVRYSIEESIALIDLAKPLDPASPDTTKAHLAAVEKLGSLQSARGLPRLQELITQARSAAGADAALIFAYSRAIDQIESWQTKAQWISNLFSGLSAGSILVLVALGLSIIFGVMGVINMAQGELVMIGAYATYITQLAFQRWMPESAYDWYFAIAIPVSFIIAALVGMLIEATVIRRLYGRPLDTLLATFGVGLILTQAVRIAFGDNIGVKAPSFLQGGVEVAQDVVLPYARLFAIGFCVACIVLMNLIINRTKLGLLLRATTQARSMAGALGVPTKRVDLYTFALGAGLAGMAGCALTTIEGVTPNMGQNYIIDSFLVVVTGGVGKLAGAIWAGLGLGVINKLLEPIFQTVWAKVIILGIVVVFLQWRPSGLFPAKGRFADA